MPAPTPYGVLPSERQLRWQQAEFYCLVHFGLNTFTDKEWGYGEVPAGMFAPLKFDADQIVGAVKAAGARGLILVAKHHDGFCLWPSAYTDYSVKGSRWRDGKGDMVREFEQACRRAGLLFGVYLSPWDRHHAEYGRAAYIEYYRNQLRELCTNYGELFMAWFDGANGGDGFYGGAREKREIDRRTYYEWDNTWGIVRELQPMAAIFSDVGPDVRWVGNEEGHAGETCWATYTPVGKSEAARPCPGDVEDKLGVEGTRDGRFWMPAECDVPLRPGWFWHADQDEQVKKPQQLLKLYYKSVGRGAALDLGIAPTSLGLLHENDVKALREFGERLTATFATDLTAGAKISASNVRGGDSRFGPRNLIDGRAGTAWMTNDDVRIAEVTVEFKENTEFNVVRLREDIRLGQRIRRFAVDAWQGPKAKGEWVQFAEGTSIGACRLIRLPRAGMSVETDRLRLRILESDASPALTELGAFLEPR